jgi:hypothetical protein
MMHGVDAISGATITSKGSNKCLKTLNNYIPIKKQGSNSIYKTKITGYEQRKSQFLQNQRRQNLIFAKIKDFIRSIK